MEAGAEILAKFYVQYSTDKNKTPKGMVDFLKNSVNSNIIFLRDAVFNYGLGNSSNLSTTANCDTPMGQDLMVTVVGGVGLVNKNGKMATPLLMGRGK